MPISRVRSFISNGRNEARGTDPQQLLRKLQSFNGECAYCGHPCEGEGGWDQIDHIQPVEYGGRGNLDNLLPACATCNRDKWHHNEEAWYLLLSNRYPHWPGAMHQLAVEVRESRGMDETAFLLLRAEAIERHGEGREREDERREREEAARVAAEIEREQERLRSEWLSAQDGLIEAEVRRRLDSRPPKVVEKVVEVEVEKVVEVARPRRWKKLTAVAAVILTATFVTGGFVSDAMTTPKVVTKTRTVTVPGPTETVVKWRTKTVYKTVEPPVDQERESKVALCIAAVEAAVREGVRNDWQTTAEGNYSISQGTTNCKFDPYNTNPSAYAMG